jgi:hypothetical protein
MGVDLELRFSPWDSDDKCPLLYTALQLGRCREVFDKLEAMATPLGTPAEVYRDSGVKKVKDALNGDPLTFVYPAQVREAYKGFTGMDWRTKAALAYMKKLPHDKKIVLWWW